MGGPTDRTSSKKKSTDGKYDQAATELARKFSTMNRHQVNSLRDEDEDGKVKKQHVHIVLLSISILFIYFVIGIACLRLTDNEMFTNSYDALYFTVVTLTSVGYGDYYPTTPSGRLFISCYAFLGLMILTGALVELVTYWLAVRKSFKEEWDRIKFERGDDDDEDDWETPPMFQAGPNRVDPGGRRAAVSIQTSLRQLSLYRLYDINKSAKKFWIDTMGVPPFAIPILQELSLSLLLIVTNVVIGAIFYAYIVDNHTIIDAIYLSACTVTTIGYGDVVPSNRWAKGFTMIYCIIGTLVTAQALNSFNNALSNYRKAFRNNIILTNQVNMMDLFMMDVDGDGTVTKAEYMIYKLMHMRLVDPEVIARVERQFHVMDTDGSGTLTIDDISKQFPNMLITHRDRNKDNGNGSRTKSGRFIRQRRSVISTSLSDVPDLTHEAIVTAAVTENSKRVQKRSLSQRMSSKLSSKDIDVVTNFDIEEGDPLILSPMQRGNSVAMRDMTSAASSIDSEDVHFAGGTHFFPKGSLTLSRDAMSLEDDGEIELADDGEGKYHSLRVKPVAEFKRGESRGKGRVVVRVPTDDVGDESSSSAYPSTSDIGNGTYQTTVEDIS